MILMFKCVWWKYFVLGGFRFTYLFVNGASKNLYALMSSVVVRMLVVPVHSTLMYDYCKQSYYRAHVRIENKFNLGFQLIFFHQGNDLI